VNGTCPYLQAAELSRLPCESDRQAISLLMGSEVEQIARIVDGAPVCEYLVRHGDDERARALHPSSETLVQHHN
jgi:predicted ArsR family transcriptional regulator